MVAAFDRSTTTEEVQAMRNRDQVWRKLIDLYNVDPDDDEGDPLEDSALEGLSAKSSRAELNKALIDRMQELHDAHEDDLSSEEDDLENDAFADWTVDEHLRAQTRMLREWMKSRPCKFWHFGTTRKDCGVCKQDPSL